AAELTERLAAGGADGVQGLGGAFRGLGGRVLAAVGQTGDDGQVVTDDVVHLAGDAGAFGCGGDAGLLVAFDLQAAGPVLEGLRVVLAGADGDADEDGHADGRDVRADLLAPRALAEPGRRDA